MLEILSKTFSEISKKPFLVLFFYTISFVLAMLVARPFYVTFLNEANTSVALDKLIADFDFMIFTDFVFHSQKAFKPFIPLISALGIIYLMLSTFFAGGVISTADQENFSFTGFFEASGMYFGKFATLLIFLLIFLLVLVSLSGMFFFIFAAIAEGGNEKEYLLWMIPPVFILVYFIIFVITLGDYARVIIFKTPQISAFQAFWKSFSYITKRPSTIALFGFIIVLGIILSLLYLQIDKIIVMGTGLTIFLMFLIQQLFVFVRTFLKISTQVVALNYYNADPTIKENKIVISEEVN